MDADLRSGVLSDYRWLHAELLAGVAEFYEQGIRFTPYVEAALEYASAAVAWSTAAMDLGCKEAEERDADAAAAMEAKYATLRALSVRANQLEGDVDLPPIVADVAEAAEDADAEADAAEAALRAAIDAAVGAGVPAAAAAAAAAAAEEEAAEAHMQVAAAAIISAADHMLKGSRPFYTRTAQDGRAAIRAAAAAAVASAFLTLAHHNLQGYGLPAAEEPAAGPAAIMPASSSSSSSSSSSNSCCWM
uniref:Uncharacterized protein n=1 Tax=Tetradesmus obliquus TaxID=3088 RepID=A0A383VWC8_TETOB